MAATDGEQPKTAADRTWVPDLAVLLWQSIEVSGTDE